MLIGVDLDDTLRDLYSSFQTIWWLRTNQIVPRESCTTYDLRQHFKHHVYDPHTLFFESCVDELYQGTQLLPGAWVALARLSSEGHQFHIITSQPNQRARMLTLTWLAEQDLPIAGVSFAEEKWRVQCDAYIDDGPHHLLAFRERGLPYLIFDAPYNQHVPGTRVKNWLDVEQAIDHAAWTVPGSITLQEA